MKSIFIHGGPGLHSEVERRVLAPIAEREGVAIAFWDQPSQTRKTLRATKLDAYDRAIASAEDFLNQEYIQAKTPVRIIAHAFGATWALELAERHPEQVGELVLIAPDTQVFVAFCRVIRLALDEARRLGDTHTVSLLEKALGETRELCDAAMLAGAEIALKRPSILLHYWHNLAAMQRWKDTLSEAPWQIDAEEQAATLLAFSRKKRRSHRLNIRAAVLFGVNDPIISRADEVTYLTQRLGALEQITFDGAAHFLALEQPEALVAWLKKRNKTSILGDKAGRLVLNPQPEVRT